MCSKRERFEAWAADWPRVWFLERYGDDPRTIVTRGEYKDGHVEAAWQAWQAACPEGGGAMSVSETAPLGTTAALKRVKKERDALAAHVERLRSALNDQLTDCINFDDGQLTESIQENSAWVIKQTPAASLARRNLLEQAEDWTPAKLFDGCDGLWGQPEGDYYVTRSYKNGELIKKAYERMEKN